MRQAPIRAAGQVLRHIVGVLLLSWLRALKAGLIVGLIGVVLVELGAIVMTRRFPPDGNAQLVAALLAFVLAFGAAATVIVDEMLEGIRDLIGMLAGEAEAGARVAATLVDREVGESSARALQMIGLGRLLGPQPDAEPTPTYAAADMATPVFRERFSAGHAYEHVAQTSETLAELADDAAVPGPSRPDAGPVPADQLPRLSWSDELPVVRPNDRQQSSQTPTPEGDSLPTDLERGPAPEGDVSQPDADASAPGQDAERATPAASALSSGLAEPAEWHAPEPHAEAAFGWHDPTLATEPQDDEESYIQPIDVFGAPPPLSSAPEPEHSAAPRAEPTPTAGNESATVGPRGSVWDHISQVLAGRPVAPLPEDPPADADQGHADEPPAAR